MKRRAIVFESLDGWNALLARWYLWRQYDVYCLSDLPAGSAEQWTYAVSHSGKIQKLALLEPLHVNNDPSYHFALEVTDTVYERGFLDNSALITLMKQLYNSDRVHLAFKKHLLNDFSDFFHSQLVREQVGRVLRNVKKCRFVPSQAMDSVQSIRYERMLRRYGLGEYVRETNVEFPLWPRVLGRVAIWKKKLRLLGVCVHTMASAIWGLALALGKHVSPRRYEFGVTIVSPLREFANAIRGVGFLLDGEKLRKDNTVFVPLVPLTQGQSDELQRNGLVVSDDSTVTPYGICKTVQVNGVSLLPQLLLSDLWIATVGAYLIRDYWKWQCFVRRYKIDKFVTYADFGFRQISRNIVLKQYGTQTWYYLDTENFGGMNFNPGPNARLHKFWSYLYYDNCVTWSERAIEYFRKHKQSIECYFPVGCLWAENIRVLKEKRFSSQLRRQLHSMEVSGRSKVVGVFDSTYNNLSRTTYWDGIGFAEAMEDLLNEMEDIFMIWKEKKQRLFHKEQGSAELISIYNRLTKHPRCYFAGYETPAEEVLALCNLAISFPFTSTTVEALGAGTRGIYYSPNGKFKGSYFDEIPGLVAHDFRDLREMTDKLLFHWNEIEYERYLNKNIKGRIDPHLDGRAITRFRDLLCAGSLGIQR